MANVREYVYNVPAMSPTEANMAPIVEVDGTNVDYLACAFNDTTEEYRNDILVVPGDLDTAGTVTFEAWLAPLTAAGAARNVQLRIGLSQPPVGDDEDWDIAYVNEDSGNIALNATAAQDWLQYATWTETVSNMTMVANDWMPFRLSRIEPASGTDLTGDLLVARIRILVPVS